MISLFKNNNPLALLLLACLAAMPYVYAPSLTAIEYVNPGNEGLISLFREFTGGFFEKKSIWGAVLSTIIVMAEAVALNKMVSDQKLFERPGFVPALSFILLITLIPHQFQSYMLLINGALLIALKSIISVYKKDKANNSILLTSFFTGIIAGFGASNLLFFLWLIISLLIMRPASLRELMLAITGFVLPYYFLISGLYLTNQLDINNIIQLPNFEFKFPARTSPIWIRSATFLVLPLLGLILANKSISKMLIQGRKTYLTIFVLYLVTLVICLLKTEQLPFNLYILAIPVSVLICPLFLSFKRNIFPNILLVIMILLCFLR